MDEASSPDTARSPPARAHNPCLPRPAIDVVEPEHCIRILVATDNHIGYAEADPIRGQDSINTFREILKMAIDQDVDMLLLAGDLFHHNRPSRASLYSTIASLREHCLNHRPIRIELVGDAGIGIPHGFTFPAVNYEDENINVGLPVFSIHGNHDDPQGIGPEGALCALDVLSASGLINYFGRQELPGNTQNDEEASEEGLHIQPILLKKGRTLLALYGIGNIRDERFHYEMRSNRIRMSRPIEDSELWFNIMLVHQNRVAHGPKNSVPENGFGDDVDFVIWGHEHDCHIEPYEVPGKGYFISQPGSSVATSLSQGEALPKHVAIFEIQDRDFRITPLPLKTVRPFVFQDITLADVEEENDDCKFDSRINIVKYLNNLVGILIGKANQEWIETHANEVPPPPPMLPLIRLRVECTRSDDQGFYDVGNPQRFGQEFTGRIANPKDVVQFYRKKKTGTRKPKNEIDLPEDEDMIGIDEDNSNKQVIQVSSFVQQYLEAQNLGVLAENGMQKAVATFVEKDDKDAIKVFYNRALKAAQSHVRKEAAEAGYQERNTDSEDDELVERLGKAKKVYAEEWEKEDLAKESKDKGKAPAKNVRDDSDSDNSDSDDDFAIKSNRRKGGGGKKVEEDEEDDSSVIGSETPKRRGQKNKAAGPSKKADELFLGSENESDHDDSDVSVVVTKKKAPAKKAATAKKAPAKKAPAKKAPAKKAATTTRGKAAASGSTQTTLAFSGVPMRGTAARGAKKTTQTGRDDVDEESD